MKLPLNAVEKDADDAERRWHRRVFGGRIRASTLALIVAFLAVWWVYSSYHTPATSGGEPANQVVPPGFVPDPNYPWVQRGRVDQPPTTVTVTSTVTTPSTVTSTLTPPNPPPFQLPCLPPFCPTSTTPTTSPAQQPPAGPASIPTSLVPTH